MSGRYLAVGDLLHDLRNATASTTQAPSQPDVPLIAVLPFANMSADPEQEYFCDGMAEELINALAGLDGLHVAARTSSFKFRGEALDATEIGTRLKVGSILEGSVVFIYGPSDTTGTWMMCSRCRMRSRTRSSKS